MDTGFEHPKADVEITYIKNNNIYEAICHKLRNKDMYETSMYKIYNIIVGPTNKQLQVEAASDATFQEVRAGRDPIG